MSTSLLDLRLLAESPVLAPMLLKRGQLRVVDVVRESPTRCEGYKGLLDSQARPNTVLGHLKPIPPKFPQGTKIGNDALQSLCNDELFLQQTFVIHLEETWRNNKCFNVASYVGACD